MNIPEPFQMDKTAFSTVSLHDPPDEPAFWHAQTPQFRMAALEMLRQMMYGYNPLTDRVSRTLEVLEHPER